MIFTTASVSHEGDPSTGIGGEVANVSEFHMDLNILAEEDRPGAVKDALVSLLSFGEAVFGGWPMIARLDTEEGSWAMTSRRGPDGNLVDEPRWETNR